jgi:hypothetical protein
LQKGKWQREGTARWRWRDKGEETGEEGRGPSEWGRGKLGEGRRLREEGKGNGAEGWRDRTVEF